MYIEGTNWVIATDTGRKRKRNEDSVSAISFSNIVNKEVLSISIFSISDGIGGKERGEVASKIAVKTSTSYIFESLIRSDLLNVPEVLNFSNGEEKNTNSPSTILKRGIERANEKIFSVKKIDRDIKIGSTLTCGILINNVLTLGFVGDTRCYLLYEEKLKQLSRDHTLSSELRESEKFNVEKYSSVLTRSLGSKPEVTPDIKVTVLEKGCKLLFCTDGLYREVDDGEIENILKREIPLHEISKQLIDTANKNGGRDNISLILVKI